VLEAVGAILSDLRGAEAEVQKQDQMEVSPNIRILCRSINPGVHRRIGAHQ
jgi:hypothetical protein